MTTKNSAPTGASLCEAPAEHVPLRFLGIFRILRFFRQWRSTAHNYHLPSSDISDSP
ncbi:MAG: hypothetical protein HDS59_03945 [Barnesiella sp.]|nr:hypothetical protein [Barnesiella sp.]